MLIRPAVRSRDPRRGFTLVELIVAVVLMGIVTASLMGAVVAQQRFYTGAGEIIQTRSQIRQAIDLLPAELRGISSPAGDIFAGAMGDAGLEFRSTFGSTIVCRTITSSLITVPPPGELDAGNILSSWTEAPEAGDALLFYDDSLGAAGDDDRWVAITIRTIWGVTNPCAGTAFTQGSDASRTGFVMLLNSAVPKSVGAGTPVRLVRRVRYALYQASDTRWYLGYCQSASLASTCSPLQPVSGPYRPYSATAGQSGLNFYYYDVNGVTTANPLLVARIDLAIRAEGLQKIRFAGASSQIFRDSARITVGLRNRN